MVLPLGTKMVDIVTLQLLPVNFLLVKKVGFQTGHRNWDKIKSPLHS